MNHKFLTIAAFCVTLAACNSSNNTNEVSASVELPGTVDNEAFAANVESISVMNLQMDDSWTITDYPKLAFADNYIYISEETRFRLACFDRQTGEKLSDRIIKGRGPGEITFLSTTFCIGDTICVCTGKNIKQYDHNLNYLGDLYEFDMDMQGYQPVRLNNGNYALLNSPFTITLDAAPGIFLTDKSFNIISEYLIAQPFFMNRTPTYYVKGDTVRCFLSFDNYIYSLCGDTEQNIELIVPNPLTLEAINDAQNAFANAFEYDGMFGCLCESGQFIVFVYRCNQDEYTAMLNKRTNSVVSIIYNKEPSVSTTDIVVDFFNKTNIIQTNDNYIYTKCKIRTVNKMLEGHDDLLDARLRETQSQYRTYLERNAEYLKGLEPEERNEANVILKIKLKD
ncbi:MAG: 6-bladed beta-propeller [Salinivirgaceae bacterium]|nr:6-bladed beta-propeller [Salinivirgaceae bacterium]